MSIGYKGVAVGGGILALVLFGTGVADASNGGSVVLGAHNHATKATTLSDSAGTPLALSAAKGHAPLAVNSTTKVTHLNADEIDGLDSSRLQRTIQSGCGTGYAIKSIAASGRVTCVKMPSSAGGGGGSISSSLAEMSEGVGIAFCPTGQSPIGGGALPDPTGADDLPYLGADMVHVTDAGVFDGWEGIAADFDGSYTGGGFVYVTCTSSPVSGPNAATTSAQQRTMTRLARQQFSRRHAGQ